MAAFTVSAIAGQRLDEIFVYTHDTWGQEQAETHLRGPFDCFAKIARRNQAWRAVPAEFGIDGYYCRYRHHYIYWGELPDETVGTVTVLHERMHLIERFRDDATLINRER